MSEYQTPTPKDGIGNWAVTKKVAHQRQICDYFVTPHSDYPVLKYDSLVDRYKCFGQSHSLHLQGRRRS
jgi:hypothetical protein